MKDPEYIYNFDIFETPEEAVDAYRRYAAGFTKLKPFSFLRWFTLKFMKPTDSDDAAYKMAWESFKAKAGKLRTLQNRDAFMWKSEVTDKDIFEAWMKWEVNNPKTGKSIADKRWILDWLFAPLDKEFDESINGKTYSIENKEEE